MVACAQLCIACIAEYNTSLNLRNRSPYCESTCYKLGCDNRSGQRCVPRCDVCQGGSYLHVVSSVKRTLEVPDSEISFSDSKIRQFADSY